MTESEHIDIPDAEQLQSALEEADPADAPDIAESLAGALSDELDEAAPSDGTPS